MHQTYLRRPVDWATAGTLQLLSALSIILLSRLSEGMAAAWLANGILVYALLVARPSERWKHYCAAFVASLVANYAGANGIAGSLVYSCANLVEAWLVMRLLVVFGLRRGHMLAPRGIATFPLIAALASAGSATIADLVHDRAFSMQWLSWFGSDLLGLVMVVPAMLVAFSRGEPDNGWGRSTRVRWAWALGATAAVSQAVFIWTSLPIVFLCILPIAFAAFQLGARGAVCASVIVAAISIAATVNNLGPFAAHTPDKVVQIYLLQSLLAALLLSGLPLASLLAREKRAAARLLAAERAARIEAHRRHRALETAARVNALANSHDSLTALASRTRILGKLRARLRPLPRHGGAVSVAVIDIDHFKQINDRFGHGRGDEVLAAFGDLASKAFTAPCAVGRLGGEEFLAILPGLTAEQAVARMEQFRLTVEAAGHAAIQGSFRISTGVASARPGMTDSDLLRMADLAMLVAKRQGRNRIALAAA